MDEWCLKACPARYRDLDLQMRRKEPPELALPRHLLQKLIAAQLVHGDFAVYHSRFKHIGANLECVCGHEISPTLFVRCCQHATHLHRLRKGVCLGV